MPTIKYIRIFGGIRYNTKKHCMTAKKKIHTNNFRLKFVKKLFLGASFDVYSRRAIYKIEIR